LCRGNPEYSGDIACLRKDFGKISARYAKQCFRNEPFPIQLHQGYEGFLHAAVPQIGRIRPAPETQNSLSPLWQNSASQPRAKGQKLG
jgi:hypothetical protein